MAEENHEVQASAKKPSKAQRAKKVPVEPELAIETLPLETVSTEVLPLKTEPIIVVSLQEETVELLSPAKVHPQPATPGPTIEERLQALKDDFRDRPEIKVERQRDPYWLFTSAIATGLAVISALLFSPFFVFLSFAGLVSGVIALGRHEKPRKLAWTSTTISGIIFIFPVFLILLLGLGFILAGVLRAWYAPN